MSREPKHHPAKSGPLSNFSMDELLEELTRRRNAIKDRKPVRPCDECANFVAWTQPEDAPADYNPCAKGHAMQFRAPAHPGYDDTPENWGFFRRVCQDRA